jgi:hypothetical protein
MCSALLRRAERAPGRDRFHRSAVSRCASASAAFRSPAATLRPWQDRAHAAEAAPTLHRQPGDAARLRASPGFGEKHVSAECPHARFRGRVLTGLTHASRRRPRSRAAWPRLCCRPGAGAGGCRRLRLLCDDRLRAPQEITACSLPPTSGRAAKSAHVARSVKTGFSHGDVDGSAWAELRTDWWWCRAVARPMHADRQTRHPITSRDSRVVVRRSKMARRIRACRGLRSSTLTWP